MVHLRATSRCNPSDSGHSPFLLNPAHLCRIVAFTIVFTYPSLNFKVYLVHSTYIPSVSLYFLLAVTLTLALRVSDFTHPVWLRILFPPGWMYVTAISTNYFPPALLFPALPFSTVLHSRCFQIRKRVCIRPLPRSGGFSGSSADISSIVDIAS